MKIIIIVTRWLFILSLPLLFLTTTIAASANSVGLYTYGFEKYNVGQTTGLTDQELKKAATGLISYLNSDDEYIDLTAVKEGNSFELFNEREIIHLKDVKGLIRLDYNLLLGVFVYVLAYAGASLFWWKERRRLAWSIIGGSALTLGLMLALGLGILLGFDQLFLQFHLLSFTNDLWLLDPTRDYLIMLFPRGLWYDAFLMLALVTAGLAIILGGVSAGYLRRVKASRD